MQFIFENFKGLLSFAMGAEFEFFIFTFQGIDKIRVLC